MKSKTSRLTLAGALALVASLPSLHAQTWDGGGLNNDWGTAANWSGDTVPTFPTALTFAGSTRLTSNNEATGRTVNGITFNNAAGAFTLTGSAITLAGNIVFSAAPPSAITQTVNLNLILSGNRAFHTSSGGNGTLVVNGNISETGGSSSLSKQQLGTMILTGSNSFTGAFTIDAGAVQAASLASKNVNSAIGAGTSINFGSGGSATNSLTLQYTGTSAASVNRDIVLGSLNANAGGVIDNNGTGVLTFNGTFTNSATQTTGTKNFTLTGTNGGDNTFQGVIGNSAGGGRTSFTKDGIGKWILEGTNTYTGGTRVTAGTLATGTTGSFGTGNITVLNGATLFLDNAISIADTATLTFGTTSVINLDFIGIETIGGLANSISSTFLTTPGTYSVIQLNQHFFGTDTGVFTGTGSLAVSAIPEPSTFAALAGIAALGLCLGSRRRAKRTAASNR